MSGPRVRRLGAADAKAYEAFLAPRAASSLFLLANVRRAGFEDSGRPFSGTYAGAFDGENLAGVAAHFWNGILAVQAPANLGEVLTFVLEASGRPLAGLTGPQEQVVRARQLLGAESRPAALDEPEGLFALGLDRLRVPEALRTGAVRTRRPAEADVPLLIAWRAAYRGEALGEPEGAARTEAAREDVRALQERREHWLLVEGEGETPLAYSAFNARLPEIAQVGGVWTPPEKRGRGYGRAVVAGSLLDARAEGLEQAVLFTSNPAARRAYEALGFRQIGEYGLVIFR